MILLLDLEEKNIIFHEEKKKEKEKTNISWDKFNLGNPNL